MAAKHVKMGVVGLYRGARSQLPDDLSVSGLVHSYEDFVSQNASAVTQIESALQTLTYIIPGNDHCILFGRWKC